MIDRIVKKNFEAKKEMINILLLHLVGHIHVFFQLIKFRFIFPCFLGSQTKHKEKSNSLYKNEKKKKKNLFRVGGAVDFAKSFGASFQWFGIETGASGGVFGLGFLIWLGFRGLVSLGRRRRRRRRWRRRERIKIKGTVGEGAVGERGQGRRRRSHCYARRYSWRSHSSLSLRFSSSESDLIFIFNNY